jgi:phosphate transport system protein
MAAPISRTARQQFDDELEQLRLQVELMAVRVDQSLERMHEVLVAGDVALAAEAIAADDEVDAMHLSLMERCYELLRREAPVASDLRFVVSVLRVLGELERIGDLSLRVHKLADRQPAISAHPSVLDVLVSMTECAIDRYRLALRAWATTDLDLAAELAVSGGLDRFQLRLTTELLALHDIDAVAVAMDAAAIGRAVDRISDHASIIGARLRYLITGDPDHLAAEVR